MYESIVSLFEQYPVLKTFMTLTTVMIILVAGSIMGYKVMTNVEETKKNEKG